MAEGAVRQLHGGLPLSHPGLPGIWSEALQSETVTRVKKLNLTKSYVLTLTNLLPTLILFKKHSYKISYKSFFCFLSCQTQSGWWTQRHFCP